MYVMRMIGMCRVHDAHNWYMSCTWCDSLLQERPIQVSSVQFQSLHYNFSQCLRVQLWLWQVRSNVKTFNSDCGQSKGAWKRSTMTVASHWRFDRGSQKQSEVSSGPSQTWIETPKVTVKMTFPFEKFNFLTLPFPLNLSSFSCSPYPYFINSSLS